MLIEADLRKSRHCYILPKVHPNSISLVHSQPADDWKNAEKILQNYLLPKRGYLELKASGEQRKYTKAIAMSEFSRGDPSQFSFMFRNNLHLCMHWAMLSDQKGCAAPKFMVCTGKLC